MFNYKNKKIMKKKITIFIMLAIIGMSGFAQVKLDSGLVAYYPFTGNANDASGNGYNGTPMNGTSLTTDRFGNTNSAYYFNGVNNYIDITTTNGFSQFNNPQSTFTYCAWIKTNYTGVGVICSNSSEDGWNFFATARVLQGYIIDNSWNPTILSATDTVDDGHWHFAVFIFSNPTLKLYVDGQLQASSNFSGSLLSSGGWAQGGINIGVRYIPNGEYFNGSIDDIRIYNRAINQSEITALYNENLCYQTITVTDTLVINANLTGFSPIAYQNSIKVYPNPTNDHITINFGSNYSTLSGYALKITNSLSQIMYNAPITQQSTSIALNTWTGSGIYFVYLIDAQSNTVDVRKIILQ